jgi:diguanylate cyclase
VIWWCFAAGQLLFVVGDVLYAVIDQVLHQSPFPSVADVFYVGGYPVLAVGLLVLIRGRISGRDRAGLIDAAIIATGLGLLSWNVSDEADRRGPVAVAGGAAGLPVVPAG